ncbi:unnamed protein product [Vitrella brassicaformis CCMP3155]|uniref:Uncharacterized protein n=1 Tax=Vitrella brassicaformis (strain CCMP3155) TaxID=1169540 RepID=A0A0G4EB50_VITBC|nr:unnamed protein product [Vitrella brassicaformis CCMP3155]|eukprot:CEL92478.1 unnamed protein product [Vitrella brassicaformis CCMP3155]
MLLQRGFQAYIKGKLWTVSLSWKWIGLILGLAGSAAANPCQRCYANVKHLNSGFMTTYWLGSLIERRNVEELRGPTRNVVMMTQRASEVLACNCPHADRHKHRTKCNLERRGQIRKPLLTSVPLSNYPPDILHIILRSDTWALICLRTTSYKMVRAWIKANPGKRSDALRVIRRLHALCDRLKLPVNLMPVLAGRTEGVQRLPPEEGDATFEQIKEWDELKEVTDAEVNEVLDEDIQEQTAQATKTQEEDEAIEGKKECIFEDPKGKLHARDILMWITNLDLFLDLLTDVGLKKEGSVCCFFIHVIRLDYPLLLADDGTDQGRAGDLPRAHLADEDCGNDDAHESMNREAHVIEENHTMKGGGDNVKAELGMQMIKLQLERQILAAKSETHRAVLSYDSKVSTRMIPADEYDRPLPDVPLITGRFKGQQFREKWDEAVATANRCATQRLV